MIVPILIAALVVLTMTAGISIAGGAEIELPTRMALLGGTIVSIDEAKLSITLRMPEGEVRSFAAKDRRLLLGLNNGDHVSFELNDADTIIRLAKLPTDPAN